MPVTWRPPATIWRRRCPDQTSRSRSRPPPGRPIISTVRCGRPPPATRTRSGRSTGRCLRPGRPSPSSNNASVTHTTVSRWAKSASCAYCTLALYTTAAMDTAGQLETVATVSYYYVTVRAADWSETSREQWLRHLNYAMLENVSIHEAYPGHFVQSLHERRVGSRTRQLFWSYATVEGFAHYVEEMMLEAGYSTDPKLQLTQRSDALLRDC